MTLPLVRKMPTVAQPPSLLPCGYSINLEKFESFFLQKLRTFVSENPSPCPQNVRTGQTFLPMTADVFYGHPLT